MKRQKRAGWALTSLAIAGFMFADLIGYGSDTGYNFEAMFGLAIGFTLLSVALFAWNVATYKR